VPAQAVFYFDLASPLAYLASERVMDLLSGPVDWQPVLARELPGWESCARASPPSEAQLSRDAIANRAKKLGLQPLRWPRPFPFDSSLAMHAATYARSIGRVIPFAQAAFRQAFAGGHSLEQADFVLIAAAACEMHPSAVLKGAALRSVDRELSQATAHAARTRILDVPALVVGERVFCGARAVEEASAHVSARPDPAVSR
jgi:2-hydroxychromene-2-carboxylate isomerase